MKHCAIYLTWWDSLNLPHDVIVGCCGAGWVIVEDCGGSVGGWYPWWNHMGIVGVHQESGGSQWWCFGYWCVGVIGGL